MNDGWLGLTSGATLILLCFGLLSVSTGYAAWLLARAARVPSQRSLLPALTPSTAAALLSILLLATALRVVGLDSGLWYDEVLTLVRFVRLSATDLLTTYTSANNHVLYSLLAHASTVALGENPFALRLPAVILGVASVLALWLLGEEVTNRRETLLAALLMAVSYHHVWFSQNARGYTGLLFFGLVGTWIFVAGMRRRVRWPWLAYATVFGLAMFTHMSAIFLFAAHGSIYAALFVYARLGQRGREPGRAALASTPGAQELWPLLGFGLGGALTLQFYAGALPAVIDNFAATAAAAAATAAAAAPAGAAPVADATSWQSPLWTALEIVRGLNVGLRSALGVAVAGVLAAAGFVSYLRRDALTACVFSVPFVVTLGILTAVSFRIWPRYFFVLVGFAALVLVRGAFEVAGAAVRLARASGSVEAQRAAAARFGTALALLPICASALSLAPNYQLPKQDYVGARDYVEAERDAGEPVVTIGLVAYPFEAYYAPTWQPVQSLSELVEIRSGGSRTWLVYSFPGFLKHRYPGIFEEVEANFEPMEEFQGTVGDGTIYVWRSRALERRANL